MKPIVLPPVPHALIPLLAAAASLAPLGSAAQLLPPGCDAANPPACLYTSDLDFPVDSLVRVQLTDPSRNNYGIGMVIRFPVGAAGPRPVVIWHHGGTPSVRGAGRSAEWSRILAAAGYVVIHPSRTPIPTPVPFETECRENGFTTPGECAYWVTQFRYGPQNTHFLVANLAAVEALDPALAGLLDGSRIVVAGHSAGSSVVLANAGAWQQWSADTLQYQERNDTPIAFLATGVQGSMYAGFNSGFQSPGSAGGFPEHSYAGIDRPFLFITGVGDETGEPPESRVAAWLTSRPGDKVLLWNRVPEAVHGTMNLDRCAPPLPAGHCDWIGSAGVAFLDAVVRGRPEAEEWLRSDALHVLSGGAVELHHR